MGWLSLAFLVSLSAPLLGAEGNVSIFNVKDYRATGKKADYRLSSASSALKFCDGNMNSVRNVTVDNCVITGSNRGIAFMVYDGGYVENVVLSNLIVNTQRFDWFWWGNGDPM
jgi:polygalacturonase